MSFSKACFILGTLMILTGLIGGSKSKLQVSSTPGLQTGCTLNQLESDLSWNVDGWQTYRGKTIESRYLGNFHNQDKAWKACKKYRENIEKGLSKH